MSHINLLFCIKFKVVQFVWQMRLKKKKIAIAIAIQNYRVPIEKC